MTTRTKHSIVIYPYFRSYFCVSLLSHFSGYAAANFMLSSLMCINCTVGLQPLAVREVIMYDSGLSVAHQWLEFLLIFPVN